MAKSVFRGLHALLSAVQDLSERPRWSWRARGGPRGDRALPVVCLISKEADGVLTDLAKLLAEVGPAKIPFARVDLDRVAADTANRWRESRREEPPLLPVLDELRHQLSADRFGTLRPSRFRHYRLVDWLTGRRLTQGDNRHESTDITELLRLWHGRRERPEAAYQAAVTEGLVLLPAPVKFLMALLFAWHRPLRFWLWTRGIRLSGGEPRWLMRQPFMLPGHSTSFTGFAELLTAGRQDEDDRAQIKKLLVHAFLQDLRELYGAGTWRPRHRRRTAYTVVLLDNVTEANGGWELLQLINDVRNESTEHDPVLVVATARAVPRGLVKGRPRAVAGIAGEVADWYKDLPARRRALRQDTIIAVTLSSPRAADEQDRRAWNTFREHMRPRAVPLPARRSFLAAVVALVLTAAVLTGGRWLATRFTEECLPSPRAGVATTWIAGDDGGECVGYSDDAAQVFGEDQRLRKAQLAVFELNREAERLAAAGGRRPLVTVVYFAEFTSPTVPDDSAGAVTEELTGLMVRQARDNTEGKLPLLRVVVANGGHEMRHARTVVDSLLAPLFAADDTAMGVVGMGRTVPATESAIGALGDLGIPVVATTLTGQGLGDRSPLYFQLVPGNGKQVALLREFAQREAEKRGKPVEVTAYQPAHVDKDSYLKTLRAELETAFGEDREWLVTWDAGVHGIDPRCNTADVDRIAYFAGREYDFDGFLDRVFQRCKHDTPMVVGNDTTSRFVADGAKRREKYAGRAMSYVSLAGAAVLENRSCFASDREPGVEPSALCAGLLALRAGTTSRPAWRAFGETLKDRATALPWVGERVGVAYDSAGLFVHAVKENRFRRQRTDAGGNLVLDQAAIGPLSRAAIGQELREISCPTDRNAPRGNCYDGASGEIGFSTDRTGESRPVSLLTLANIADLAMAPTCSYIVPAAEALCPRP
ncbi:hypothetical protein [Saccharothrix stipae]